MTTTLGKRRTDGDGLDRGLDVGGVVMHRLFEIYTDLIKSNQPNATRGRN